MVHINTLTGLPRGLCLFWGLLRHADIAIKTFRGPVQPWRRAKVLCTKPKQPQNGLWTPKKQRATQLYGRADWINPAWDWVYGALQDTYAMVVGMPGRDERGASY